jgi:hypothetical protein
METIILPVVVVQRENQVGMKNIPTKLSAVLSLVAVLSCGALASGVDPDFRPLAANTPTQFNECEHTIGDPIKGHWTRTAEGFNAGWENGAHASLQFTRNDATEVILVRNDASGSTTGLTATYVGKMVGPNEFQGTVTWTSAGKESYGEWSATCDAQGNATESESSNGGDICGTWARANHKITGHWQNGADAELIMQRFGSDGVVVTRNDQSGTSGGMIARYVGTIGQDGSVSGTVSWTQNGKSWSGGWHMTWPVTGSTRP